MVTRARRPSAWIENGKWWADSADMSAMRRSSSFIVDLYGNAFEQPTAEVPVDIAVIERRLRSCQLLKLLKLERQVLSRFVV